MENGNYKDLEPKPKSTKFLAIALTLSVIFVCTIVGLGTWVMIVNSENPLPTIKAKEVIEEVVVVENSYPAQELNKEASEIKNVNLSPVESEIIKEIEEELEEGQDIQYIEEDTEIDNPFLQSLVELGNTIATEIMSRLSEQSELGEPEIHSRKRRSIMTSVGLQALKYINYLSFGRFMFDEVYSITEYAVEGRKLSGDADTFFLDNGFWQTEQKAEETALEKSDDESPANSIVEQKPNRPASAYDDGWEPMVNKVSLKFVQEMLTTLLNLMREYLMKDNVMECLWFMFCKDMNHQAKYTDPMGYLARINSVGLKVLVEKEGREVDSINSMWQALTNWQPLQCDAMFPRCDGSKALEIVNEVANNSR